MTKNYPQVQTDTWYTPSSF